jgi:hypothetical protein
VLYHAAHDHDFGDTRRFHSRRVAFVAVINVVRLRLRPSSVSNRYGFALGQCLGTVVYRLRYGVIGAFPESLSE